MLFNYVFVALAAFLTFGIAVPTDNDLVKRYPRICNWGRGPFSSKDLQDAIGAVRDNEFNVCPDNKCCVTPGLSNHLTVKGKVYVSLRAEVDPKAPVCASRSGTVSAMQRIYDGCGSSGGSIGADDNTHLVIHMTDDWV